MNASYLKVSIKTLEPADRSFTEAAAILLNLCRKAFAGTLCHFYATLYCGIYLMVIPYPKQNPGI